MKTIELGSYTNTWLTEIYSSIFQFLFMYLITFMRRANCVSNAPLQQSFLGNAESSPRVLSWSERLRIAVESAQGLEYLHNRCKPPIIHRDIKTTNILLNGDLQAKLGDFGLSKTFQTGSITHLSTLTIAGTPGYCDPEYIMTHRLTTKSDVYSFGVVLHVIITGRPAISKTNEMTHISQWVSFISQNGEVKDVVDPRLCGDFDVDSVTKVLQIAMACTSIASTDRPTMLQVMNELHDCLAAELSQRKQKPDWVGSLDSVETCSENTISVSTLPGR